VPGRALLAAVLAAAALAVPAYADGSVQFTLGRVIHATPDAKDRIGIRSSCDEPGGCKVLYTLTRGTTSIGGVDALLLGSTVQTDYVTLTKRMAASLRRRRTEVTITAQVSDSDGNKMTVTKKVTLGPKKKR
jgi:hypothetical protein